MSRLIIRLAINALALYAAIELVPGIQSQSTSVLSILVLALIFGAVNALLRPLLKLMTCPLILLTLGLFTLVINAGMFALAGWIGSQFEVGFTVDGFVPALLGSIIVSLVSIVLSLFLRDELEGKNKKR
jgi:putative membrane protein